jgi:hypothetical protein
MQISNLEITKCFWIAFIMYTHNHKIGNQNNLKVVGSMKANRCQQDIKIWEWPPKPEGGVSYFW